MVETDVCGMMVEVIFLVVVDLGEAPSTNPMPSIGSAGLPDFKATLDALDAASRQAVGGQQPGGRPQSINGTDPENSLIEAVMRKLLSKEILYDPLLVCFESISQAFDC